jgi:prepilin-type N-terminal cleavage/methylation domain-containing protein
MTLPTRRSDGFTLIELMIVVAVIGLLGTIAVPKFANLVRKSNEAATLGHLGTIRSALTIYHADTDGAHPNDHLECLVANGKYLIKIPECDLPPYHLEVNTVFNATDVGGAALYTTELGHWIYFQNPTLAPSGPRNVGEVWIACNHLDSRNRTWSSH